MSTVLTKPVLLDETGQAIVEKLQDIQQAIGGTGEFIPINIRVTTPPTKTNYLAGEALDLSGMVVTLVANNGGMYDVTGDCVFSPADGSTVTSSTTEVSISYTWYKDSTVFTAVQPISIKELVSIAVTTPPTVTVYDAGDTLDLTGMVVTATFADGSTTNVTNQCDYSPADGDVLDASDTAINISLTMGPVTKTTTQAINVIAIYGVEWDGTATTTWTRTDAAANFEDPVPYVSGAAVYSSPFDNIMPWSGMVIEERSGGTCVKIPRFWYKLSQNGDGLKIQISSSPLNGFKISPAHMDRGDGEGEREIVYIGRYHCDTDYKSTTGVMPKVSMARDQARTSIHNLGANIWQSDFAMRFTIWLLYLVEFANWNSQNILGYGCGTSSTKINSGYTDSMPYHTGTSISSRTTYGAGIQYRHIEGLWDNVQEWCDGCYGASSASAGLNLILNPANFSDTTGGINLDARGGGVPSKFKIKDINGLYPLFVAQQTFGDKTTYSCDDWLVNTKPCFYVGGAGNNQDLAYGLFYISSDNSSNVSSYRGARLMELPANT